MRSRASLIRRKLNGPCSAFGLWIVFDGADKTLLEAGILLFDELGQLGIVGTRRSGKISFHTAAAAMRASENETHASG